MKNIDLHLHTNLSDGLLSPENLVKLAIEKNCKVISITDHDLIRDHSNLAKKYGITIIPGIEFNTATRNMHILGYGMTDINPIVETMDRLRKINEQVCFETISKLQQAGYDISIEKVKKLMDNIGINCEVMDKRKLVKYLIHMGYSEGTVEAYRDLIGAKSKYYVPNKKISPQEIIELVRSCHGITVLAHPNTLKLEYEELRELVMQLKSFGLSGIEIENNKSNAEIVDNKRKVEEYKKIAQELDLLKTFGSDFHYPEKDNFGVLIDEEDYEKIEKELVLRLNNGKI